MTSYFTESDIWWQLPLLQGYYSSFATKFPMKSPFMSGNISFLSNFERPVEMRCTYVLFREYGLRDIAQSPVARNTDLHTSLHQSPSFENHTTPFASFPVLKDPLKNIVDSSPQSKSVDCLSENSGDRKRASNPLEPSNPKEKTRKTLPTFRSSSEYPSDTPVDADAATEMVAGSIFSKIRFQYEAYMKKAQTDTDRHIIRCQAYSVVRAKCRRSSEIKTRVGELVLEFMQNDISSNNVISEIELNEIRSVMYDSASKYKFSLTSTV